MHGWGAMLRRKHGGFFTFTGVERAHRPFVGGIYNSTTTILIQESATSRRSIPDRRSLFKTTSFYFSS